MEIILSGIDSRFAEELVGLMEHYLDNGYYMSPLRQAKDGTNQWFLVPLDVLEGSSFFN
jgi:hypothetical protein